MSMIENATIAQLKEQVKKRDETIVKLEDINHNLRIKIAQLHAKPIKKVRVKK